MRNKKELSRIRVTKAATFEVTESKATVGVGKSGSKGGFMASFFHPKKCIAFHLAQLLSDEKKNFFGYLIRVCMDRI
jgi:hypothetical protein